MALGRKATIIFGCSGTPRAEPRPLGVDTNISPRPRRRFEENGLSHFIYFCCLSLVLSDLTLRQPLAVWYLKQPDYDSTKKPQDIVTRFATFFSSASGWTYR